MALTYTQIGTTTVSAGGASTITFSSIPATYTDLIIKLSGRTTQAVIADNVTISFNGSTANFQTGTVIYGDGGGTGGFAPTRWAGSQEGNNGPSGTFASIDIYIAGYATANTKPFRADAVTENNVTTAYAYCGCGQWTSSSAINSITLTPNAGNFMQFTTATLYGIKNS